MTLIATHISKYGIVQASDSNLTAGDKVKGQGKKVFDVPFASAALSIAGTYSVGGLGMDEWVMRCLADYGASQNPTLTGFAEYLRTRLTSELDDDEREDLTLIHIAGYVDAPGGAHPVMLFVRNVTGMNPDGSYIGSGTRECQLSEDFWARDYAMNNETKVAMASGGWHSYFNGFPEGRIAYLGLTRSLNAYFRQVWFAGTLRFRAPTSLEEVGAFAELELRAMDVMFRSSNYPSRYVGGEPQVRLIAPPPNAVAF